MRIWRFSFVLLLAVLFALPFINAILPGVAATSGVLFADDSGEGGEGDGDQGDGDDIGDSGSNGGGGDSGFPAGSGSGKVFLILNHKAYRGTSTSIVPVASLSSKVDYSTKIYKNNPGEYLINSSRKKSWLYNARTGRLKSIPHVWSWNGTIAWIGGKSIGFKHGHTKSYPLVAKAPGRVRTDWSYNRWNSSKFFFLPDGRHLFTHCPGMGKRESLYFIDKIIGQNQTLFYVPSYPGRPRPVLVTDAVQKPTFIDGGKAIAYFRMKGVAAGGQTRTLVIESVDVTTRKVTPLVVFQTPGKGTSSNGRRHYIRGVPPRIFFTGHPWIVFQKNENANSSWYAVNTRTRRTKLVSGGNGWQLIQPLGGRTAISPHLLFGRVDQGVVQLKAISLSDFSTVFRASFRPAGTVRYFTSSSLKGDYLP